MGDADDSLAELVLLHLQLKPSKAQPQVRKKFRGFLANCKPVMFLVEVWKDIRPKAGIFFWITIFLSNNFLSLLMGAKIVLMAKTISSFMVRMSFF